MDRKWFAVNGVCRQFTQGKISTLHFHQGHMELQTKELFAFHIHLSSQTSKSRPTILFNTKISQTSFYQTAKKAETRSPAGRYRASHPY